MTKEKIYRIGFLRGQRALGTATKEEIKELIDLLEELRQDN
jgi:hypothetical protein